MATVVSVYEVDPYPRTAKSILGLEQPPERKRLRPENKRTWARVEADQGTVIEQACAEAVRGDPDQQMRWRSVAIFCETRNGVHPISGAKNQATAMAFGGPRSSCVRPGVHSARRLRSLAFLCSSVVLTDGQSRPPPSAIRSIP